MNKIKELRNKYGLTQAKLAQMYDIPKRTIENWESAGKTGRKPPEYVINLLERCLEIDCQEEKN